MKIAQVSPLFESVPPTAYGGTERIVSYLTEELVRQGHEVTLFASGDSITDANLVPVCQTSLRAAQKPAEPTAQGLITLESVFSRAEEFDIIHCHVDYLAFPFIRRSEGKGISTQHGRLDIEELRDIYNQYGDIPLVSISNAQRKPIPGLNWRERIFHGLPKDLYRFNDKPEPYLCFIGRVSPEKGIEEAIKTANKAGIPLKIGAKVDPTDREYYETRVKPLLAKSPQVEFLGELNQHDKEQLMRGAIGQLFPTMCHESFGLVMIEAMACGTPIIATPFGSVPEVIEEGVTGTICTTIDQAVAACDELEKYDRKAIREQFETRFSSEIMAKNYVALFEDMIDKRNDNDITRARKNRSVIQIGTNIVSKLTSKLSERMLPIEAAAGGSRRSMVALDMLNFFLGPVRGGAGTYVAYYFAAMRHFDAASIGMMLGIMSVSLGVSQIPAGVIVDKMSRRREFTAGALVAIALGWALMIFYPALPVVLSVQIIVGILCAVFAPMVASMTLGLVGYDKLDRRVGRNAVFANAGNVATAILVASLTQFYGGNVTLYLLAGFALMAAASSLAIKSSDVNMQLLQVRKTGATSKLATLLAGVNVFTTSASAKTFAIVAALYTFANASMLPLMVQYISRRSAMQTAVELPTALLLTEFVMIPAAWFASRQAWAGRKPLLALSFAALMIRGASFAFVHDPTLLVGLQIFDGISSGIFTVLMTLVLADVTRGTGRFSSSISALAMLISLTNAASEYLCGVLAASMGFGFAFGLMTFIAALGFGIMMVFMPETCAAKSDERTGEPISEFTGAQFEAVVNAEPA